MSRKRALFTTVGLHLKEHGRGLTLKGLAEEVARRCHTRRVQRLLTEMDAEFGPVPEGSCAS